MLGTAATSPPGVALEARRGVGALEAVAGAASVRREQRAGPEGLRGLHRPQPALDRVQAGREQSRGGHDGDRAAVLARGRDGGGEEVATGQRTGTVVDRDDVDLAPPDLAGEDPQGGLLGRVPGVAPGDDEHLVVAEVRREGLADRVLLAVAHHHDHAAYVVEGERVAHRPGEDRGVAQRQQDLVDVGSDPGAGAGGEDHDGGGHGVIVRPVRP